MNKKDIIRDIINIGLILVCLVLTYLTMGSTRSLISNNKEIGKIIAINNTEIYRRAYFEGVNDVLGNIVINTNTEDKVEFGVELTDMFKLLDGRMHQYNIEVGASTE